MNIWLIFLLIRDTLKPNISKLLPCSQLTGVCTVLNATITGNELIVTWIPAPQQKSTTSYAYGSISQTPKRHVPIFDVSVEKIQPENNCRAEKKNGL